MNLNLGQMNFQPLAGNKGVRVIVPITSKMGEAPSVMSSLSFVLDVDQSLSFNEMEPLVMDQGRAVLLAALDLFPAKEQAEPAE